MHNSKITWMEETARNLSYNGIYSIKKLVNMEKFLPQDSSKETTAPAKKAYFIFR